MSLAKKTWREGFACWRVRVFKSVSNALMGGSGFQSQKEVEVLFSPWFSIMKRLFGFWSN